MLQRIKCFFGRHKGKLSPFTSGEYWTNYDCDYCRSTFNVKSIWQVKQEEIWWRNKPKT